MAKISLKDTRGGYDLSSLNSNFQKLEQELQDKVLYRDNPSGEPNQLEGSVDLNGNRLLNIPSPVYPTDLVRLKDITKDGYSPGDVVIELNGIQPYTYGEAAVRPDAEVGQIVQLTDRLDHQYEYLLAIDNPPDGDGVLQCNSPIEFLSLVRRAADNTSTHKRFRATAEDDAGTPDALFKVVRTHTRGNSGHSFADQSVFDPTVDGIAFASYDANTLTPSENTNEIDHMVAYQSRVNHFSSGDLNTYAALWAIDRIEDGATCTNYFPFYDQGRTEGTTTNHYSMVSDPAVNGEVSNRAGVRVKVPRGSGSVTNTHIGLYVEDLTFGGGATTYPIFVALQDNESYIGCQMLFKNQCIFEGLTIAKAKIVPSTSESIDLGASNLKFKTVYSTTASSDIINLLPQSVEPSGFVGSTIAMSDGTPSTNSFGTSGEGLYRKNSIGTWVFIG